MAVRQAFGDFTVLSHSDIKPAAVRLLEHHYPDIPNLGDMWAIDYTALDRADLMIGSWPCQPHSSAGKRLGEADPRDLWPEYLRAIDAHRPSIFFGENVGRIVSNGELRRVAETLAQRGYVGAWVVRSAADVGACHLRKRCFVVAVDATSAYAAAQRRIGWSDRQGAGRDAPKRGEAGDHAGVSDPSSRLSLLPTPSTRNINGIDQRGRAAGDGGIDLQTALAYLPTPSVADSRNTRNATANRSPGQEHHHAGWTLSDVAHAERWGKYGLAIARHEQVLGRPAPAPTVGVTKNGNPQLNARFVEFMQMLPDGWVTGIPGLTRSQQLSLLGDGVVPVQGASAFTFLLGHLAQRLTAERAA